MALMQVRHWQARPKGTRKNNKALDEKGNSDQTCQKNSIKGKMRARKAYNIVKTLEKQSIEFRVNFTRKWQELFVC